MNPDPDHCIISFAQGDRGAGYNIFFSDIIGLDNFFIDGHFLTDNVLDPFHFCSGWSNLQGCIYFNLPQLAVLRIRFILTQGLAGEKI